MIRLASVLFLLIFPSLASAQAGWLRDYSQALVEARRTGKSLFVVFRCDPCDDTADFDQKVNRLDDELTRKFIRVRLTRITGIDLNLFQFDYDNTWFAMFLDSNERVLGRFGGRDGDSPTTYLTIPGLKHEMEAVLERVAQKEETPRRDAPRKVEEYPAAKKVRGNACIHCHLAKVFEWDLAQTQKRFSRDDFFVYPPPESIGLKVDPNRGDTVLEILPASSAEKLGLKPGDRIRTLNGSPIASYADITHALNLAPKSGEVVIDWIHGEQTQKGKLALKEGWRKSDLSWRPSMFDHVPKLHISGDDLEDEDKKALGLGPKQFAMRQDKFVHSTLKSIGMKANDILLGVDGRKFEGTAKQLQLFVKKNYLAGDKITLNLIRDGKPLNLELELK